MTVLSVDLASRNWSDLGVVLLERRSASALPGFGPLELPLGPEDSLLSMSGLKECSLSGLVECEIIQWATSPADQWATSLTDQRASSPISEFASSQSGQFASSRSEFASSQSGDGGFSAPVSPLSIDPEVLAGRLNHLCGVRGVRVMLLDGPQAWKSEQNGLEHARVSERELNTAGKTGLPGVVKPVTYRAFAEFCMDVYDALCRRGWRRLTTRDQCGNPSERVLVESYPHAAWKSLGLSPLPSKRRCRVSDLATAMASLRAAVPLRVNRPPNHDQLQAIVAGLAGLAIADRSSEGTRLVGEPPRREQGHWREGFIALPVIARPSVVRRVD